MELTKPSADDCSSGKTWTLPDGRTALALWYPQMGGYVGECVAVFTPGGDGCFEAYVWHDGEFPFDGGEGDNPRVLHHCDPERFIGFGERVRSAMSGDAPRTHKPVQDPSTRAVYLVPETGSMSAERLNSDGTERTFVGDLVKP